MWSSGSIAIALGVTLKFFDLAVVSKFSPASWNGTAFLAISAVYIW